MATESPIRMPETTRKWPTHKETATFVTSSANMAAEELGLLRKTHIIHGNGRETVPNRSGSAPPSMEGSFLAIDNLLSQQSFSTNSSFPSLNGAADRSYLSYYRSNVNLNPRISSARISRENQHLMGHIGEYGNTWGFTSVDDSGNSSLHLSKGALSTHKEESEDDCSPQQSPDGILDQTNGFWVVHDAAPLAGQQHNLADFIQEDIPNTSSPHHCQSHSSSYEITEEAGEREAGSSSLQSTLSTAMLRPDADNTEPSSDVDPASSFSSLSSRGYSGTTPSTQPIQKVVLNDMEIYLKNEVLVDNVTNPDVPALLSDMKNLNISNLPNFENQETQEQRQNNYHNIFLQHQAHQQGSNSIQFQNAKTQMGSQGVNGAFIGSDQFLHAPSKFSADVQPVLQSSGYTPPLYATAAAYLTSPNPFFQNVQAPGVYSPQYGVGGYPVNSSFYPPFVSGYPPHGAIPLVFDGTAGPNFNTQLSGVSNGGNVVHGVDMQYFNKFQGQVGFGAQPSFTDQLYMQYYQQPFGQPYNMPGHIDPSASRGGVAGNQKIALGLQKGSDISASLDDQKFYHHRSGLSNQNAGRVGTTSPQYYGNQPNMSIMMQYPSSTLANPVLPGSPVGGASLPVGRNEMRYPSGTSRYAGLYSGWQGQRGFESFSDPKICNFLEELKSGKGRRFELSDIAGNIVEFSADQHGSRFIQQKLENCSFEEKESVFKEVLPHASKLMTDVFGNYVIQKFFEYGSSEQRRELANQLTGQILTLSLQMYGCRVIQKALEVIELEQKAQLVRELDGHVMRCVRDQNGNHVIQKCIESVPTDKIAFIISAFRSHVATLSMHPYGCRVIQRVLEHCTDDQQCQFIVDEILDAVCSLAQDQYGNYVTQHVLERGKPNERAKIISKLAGHIVQLSQHKFASNVVEKCLEYGGSAERELIIEEIVGHNEGNDNLLIMMKDQFANYVVQKIFDRCTDSQRAVLLSRIKVHAHALKKYTYGKHIVARFEQQFGEENQVSGS